MSTTHTALYTLLMSLVLACRAAATVASMLCRGATRMPGVMPSRGYTCRITSRPVSFPLDTSTPPTMSDAFTLLGSSWLPLTVRLVASSPFPSGSTTMFSVPSSFQLVV